MSEEHQDKEVLHSLPFLDYRTTPIYQPPSFIISIFLLKVLVKLFIICYD